MTEPGAADAVRAAAWPPRGTSEDYDSLLRLIDDARRLLGEERLERAIGVVYRPETERISHYFSARLPDQFDAILHFDETRAVEPLDRTAGWETGEASEAFPSGV
jgi:erythromycin esterase-like protein